MTSLDSAANGAWQPIAHKANKKKKKAKKTTSKALLLPGKFPSRGANPDRLPGPSVNCMDAASHDRWESLTWKKLGTTAGTYCLLDHKANNLFLSRTVHTFTRDLLSCRFFWVGRVCFCMQAATYSIHISLWLLSFHLILTGFAHSLLLLAQRRGYVPT